MRTRVNSWIFPAVLLGAMSLRIWGLGAHDFWYDEINTAGSAGVIIFGWNAPLYGIIIHFWAKVFGASEFALRFPSALFSVLAIVPLFHIGRKCFGDTVGICAAVIMALSPFHLWYAQEARDYSLLLFAGTVSSYFLLTAITDNSRRAWVLFLVSSVIGIYTHYFYMFLFLSHGICAVFFLRERSGYRAAAYFSAATASFLPYLPRFISKLQFVQGGFWVPLPVPGSIITTLENFMLGYNGSSSLYFISNVIAAALVISASIYAYKRSLGLPFGICAVLFAAPLLIAFLFSRHFFPVYLDRGLIFSSPYYYIILALGIVSFSGKMRAVAGAAILALLLVGGYRYYADEVTPSSLHRVGAYGKKPIKPVVRFIKENLAEGDIIAFTNTAPMVPFGFYSGGRRISYRYFFDPRYADLDWQRPIQESRYNIPVHKIAFPEAGRIWLIASDFERSGKLDKNSVSVKEYMDTHFRPVSVREFDGLFVSLYEK
ncbi:MAG: glycosyltransferase family 39 protein [Candidatus Omnitrophota bacterium]